MASVKVAFQLCVFCYKVIDPSLKTAGSSYQIEKLTRFLSRFVKCQDIEPYAQSDELCSINKFLKCCGSCNKIVEKCCEMYHQLKLLELQLDFKLNNLVERIDHANKVPTRWLSLIKMVEESYQNDKVKQVECQNLIRSFRQNVVKAGDQRIRQSQPRVMLTKVEKISQTSEAEITDLDDNDNLSETNLIKTPINRYKNCDMDTRKLRRELKDKKCPKCGKQLKSFKGLYIHLEHHKDQSEWAWECGECHKKFATKINLTTHLKTHTGEKPFICRFCEYKYRSKHSLRLHLLQNHLNEKGVREEVYTRYYREKEGNQNGNIFQRYKQKYLIRKKGQTKVVYYQKGQTLAKSNLYGYDRHKFDGGNDDVIVEMENDIDDDLANGPEINNGHTDKNVEEIESSPVEVFKDPQIQIKLEHPNICEDLNQSLENISNSNMSQNFNESEKTSRTNSNKSNIESSTVNLPHSRYSLREKRQSKFTSYLEPEPENFEEKDDIEFTEDLNSSVESSQSEQEDETDYKFVQKRVRRQRILNGESTNRKSKSKALIIKCEICSRLFQSFLKKEYHFKIHHDLNKSGKHGIFRCKKGGCSAYFLSNQQVYFHYEREHNIPRRWKRSDVEKKRFTCKICGKCFPGNLALNTHLEYHKDPKEWKWECGLCGKKSATEYKLKDHMRTHTNEKPYECRFCEERFRSDYKYKEHLSVEHGDEEDIRMEMESKRLRVKGQKEKVNIKRKYVKKAQGKIIGDRASKFRDDMVNKRVEVNERNKCEESRVIAVKQEMDNDVVFNELDEMGADEKEYLNGHGETVTESVDEIFDESEVEIGESGKVDGVVVYDGVNIFRKGKYFGDGTLAELEDLE